VPLPVKERYIGFRPAVMLGLLRGFFMLMIAWKSEGTALYQSLSKELYEPLKPCEPLRAVSPGRKPQSGDYKTWNETKK
jgi:hypothetical protein